MLQTDASGYIPRESVVGGLMQLFNTFGSDAKKKRQAELEQMNAQTDSIRQGTAWLGDRSAQGWTGLANDTRRADSADKNVEYGHQDFNTHEGNQVQNAINDLAFKYDALSHDDPFRDRALNIQDKVARTGQQNAITGRMDMLGTNKHREASDSLAGKAFEEGKLADAQKFLLGYMNTLGAPQPPKEVMEPLVLGAVKKVDPNALDVGAATRREQEKRNLAELISNESNPEKRAQLRGRYAALEGDSAPLPLPSEPGAFDINSYLHMQNPEHMGGRKLRVLDIPGEGKVYFDPASGKQTKPSGSEEGYIRNFLGTGLQTPTQTQRGHYEGTNPDMSLEDLVAHVLKNHEVISAKKAQEAALGTTEQDLIGQDILKPVIQSKPKRK